MVGVTQYKSNNFVKLKFKHKSLFWFICLTSYKFLMGYQIELICKCIKHSQINHNYSFKYS